MQHAAATCTEFYCFIRHIKPCLVGMSLRNKPLSIECLKFEINWSLFDVHKTIL